MNKNDQQLIDDIKALAEENSLAELIKRAKAADGEERLAHAFAACSKAAARALEITPFDEQLLAALALVRGSIVQMQTGEGKTLAAVFAAYYFALEGKNVHVLTFNDYLAKRDRSWMKPVYDLLGTETAFIQEKTDRAERRAAYRAPVLYITAKECCFDFLRDFTAQEEKDIVGNGYDCAIIDEADSILIDEARIPLVVAGDVAVEPDGDLKEISDYVRALKDNCYEISLESRNVYLTERGARETERFYGIDNLYDAENNELMMKINACLKAWFLLEENKDYIVRDGEIRLIDEFTGRVARNRHYPGELQAAVETKHGLVVSARGSIMGTVPLQFFIRQYGFYAGMTGTAASAKNEFSELYALELEVIPPHSPCARIDNEIEIYYDDEAKWSAVIAAIKAAHDKNQPVLVGTASIEASEKLLSSLNAAGIDGVVVLNAKNDEMEADIIREAGTPGRITVSTNMAGRGVDIKLGGADGKARAEAVEAGGLLVIGTFLADSERVNSQLTGRAGRQGDPGESRRFVSLDEKPMEKYGIKALVPAKHYPAPTKEKIDDAVLLREVKRIQRISAGDALDERKRLLKFTMIGEKHRAQIFGTRMRFLKGAQPEMWAEDLPELYGEMCEKYGEEKVNELERRTVIAKINDFWREYLEYTDSLREGIHLSAIGGKSPAEEYNISVEEYYDGMEEALREDVDACLEALSEDGAEKYEIPFPEHIRTYLLEDNGDELNKAQFASTLTEDETMELYYKSLREQEELDLEFGAPAGKSDDEPEEPTAPEKEADEAPAEKKKSGFFGLFRKK